MRVAMLAFWHFHAEDYAAEAQAHPDLEIVPPQGIAIPTRLIVRGSGELRAVLTGRP